MLTIRLIGTFRIDLDEQEVTVFQSNKVRGLLAYLAAEWDRPHARESLAGLLWPEYPNPSALTYLRNALSNLRHVTGDAHFYLVTRKTLQLNQNSSIWVDLRAFQEAVARPFDSGANFRDLQDAIALCRGPFLEGLSCDSPVFEEWALAGRERIRMQFLEALKRLAEAYAERGEFRASVETARRVLELEPWDEEAHRKLILGLARNGQRGPLWPNMRSAKRCSENHWAWSQTRRQRRWSSGSAASCSVRTQHQQNPEASDQRSAAACPLR